MPYDLQRGAARIHAAYDAPMRLRQRMLDMLFAAGCSVSEQAVALAEGEAMALQAAGVGGERQAQPRVFIAVDVEAPGPRALKPRWPGDATSLGGPDVAVGWLALVRALVEAEAAAGWHAVYVRGPAVAVDGYLASIAQRLPRAAALYQLVPAATATERVAGPLHALRLSLRRPKNVWRLPACDHAYVLEGVLPSGEVLPRLRSVLGRLGRSIDWTLHELQAASGAGAHVRGVLRTSAPVDLFDEALRLTPLADDSRLMFPVNDALDALESLAAGSEAVLAAALRRPLAMQVQPDGLVVETLVGDEALAGVPALAKEAGGLQVSVRHAALSGDAPLSILDLPGVYDLPTGPVPGRLDALGATALRLPELGLEGPIGTLHEAFARVIGAA